MYGPQFPYTSIHTTVIHCAVVIYRVWQLNDMYHLSLIPLEVLLRAIGGTLLSDTDG